MNRAVKIILLLVLVGVLCAAFLAVAFVAQVVACFSPFGEDCNWSDPGMAGFVAVGALLIVAAGLVTYALIRALTSPKGGGSSGSVDPTPQT